MSNDFTNREASNLALGMMLAGIFMGGVLVWSIMRPDVKKTPPPEPPAIVAPTDPEAWIDRRLEIVNERCGPVPFRVSMTKEWIDIDCGRPPNVGKVRVPRSESTATVKVAEVKP